MIKTNIKTVIFDYAGVLTPTRDNFVFAEKYCKRFKMDKLKLLELTYLDWDKASVNEIPAKIFWQNIAKKLKIEPEALKEMIMDTFELDQRVIDLITNLHKKYTIVLMSNQVEDWLEKVIDDNNLRGKFDYFINSYNIGIKKPERGIFDEAIARTGSKYEECLFIDDSLKNINAARSLGIHTVQFEKYNQVLKELKRYINIY